MEHGEEKLYNLDFLNKVSNGDKAFIDEMMNTFIETSSDYLTLAKEQLKEQKFEALGKETHKFIPGVTFLGLKQLEDRLLLIEDYCKKSENLEEVPLLLSGAEEIIRKVTLQFKQDFNI